ncbi:MAG: serine/threonine protein phosphatase [Deltaproteobacteria bacterium]|nr:MAG: serine/threonine protein phosphatase [Deltaproteobacteria bacterium]
MRIIIIGDIHMAVGRLAGIADLAEADLVIINGDLTNFGGIKEARQVIEKIRDINPEVLAQFGNLDKKEVGRWLEEEGLDIHAKARFRQEGFWLVGLGGSNPTPFRTPTEFSEKELAEMAADAFDQRTDTTRPTLFVSHCPPVNTVVDRISSGIHVGSTAVREAIKKYCPALCVSGHIHEARGKDMVGTTPVYNPGMLQNGGWVEIDFRAGLFQARLHP